MVKVIAILLKFLDAKLPRKASRVNYIGGTGISTCCPSATPFGLVLGPDLPWEDEPSPGTLRQTVEGILTLLALLTPAFSLLIAPTVLTIHLRRN